MRFEIACAETGTPNNIRNALKHCASKPNCEIAIIFYPDADKVDMKLIRKGLALYFGLRGKMGQFQEFKKIYMMTSDKIFYTQ